MIRDSKVGWILRNSVSDYSYSHTIPELNDEELEHCIEHEKRKSGLSRLNAELKRRQKDKK